MIQLHAILPIVHGAFNALVVLLLFYQGWLGLTIRRKRRSRAAFPLASVKRHRKLGPYLPYIAGFGYLAGIGLIFFNGQGIFSYPLHLAVGTALVLLLFLTRKISRAIRSPDSPVRNIHFRLGLAILALAVVQAAAGLRILL